MGRPIAAQQAQHGTAAGQPNVASHGSHGQLAWVGAFICIFFNGPQAGRLTHFHIRLCTLGLLPDVCWQ